MDPPTAIFCATPTLPSTREPAAVSTAGAAAAQHTAATDVNLDAATVLSRRLLHLQLLPSQRLVLPPPEMMADVEATSAEPLATPTVHTEDAARLTAIVAPPMVTVSLPMAVKMAAKMLPQLARPLPLLPPTLALLRSPALASLFLVSPRASSAPSRLVSPLSMGRVVPLSATQSAVTGPRALAAACTDTVVTPLLTAARAARMDLVTRLPANLLPLPALLLLPPSLVPLSRRAGQVCPPCMLV